METQRNPVDRLGDLAGKISRLYMNRLVNAQNNFLGHVQKSLRDRKNGAAATSLNPVQDWNTYATDFAQRFVLFWDIMRERGNRFIEHERAGKPPLLAFKWEIVADGRTYERPVNYALTRIIPPPGIQIDEAKRPFVIVDPRAGHGAGVGGFKVDSQVGVAMEFGHPVYFVIFFPDPEPGQTIVDVCIAESKFLQAVVERHPKSPKPTIYGNCQGGWASMLVAATDPERVGPIVMSGAPMSYWSGSWSGGEGENPMRYSGGLLGGSWTALLSSDLGNGKFDGAYLVQNFESLNPANTYWDKYYNVWKSIDKERERYLEFEKWWGGFFQLNEEEIRWIVDNLFIGNKLARGEVPADPCTFIDLKAIRSPVVIFSSKGDNITPPQQAINWISDVYSSTAEIKANGQVLVTLLQEDVGHLAIFVSGKVVRKEHAEIMEALDYIELLRPGLYVMEIEETSGKGKDKYLSSFREARLEDLRRLNRLGRKDERPFEVVAEVSEMNERAYRLFGRPLVRSMVNETIAEMGRILHPMRVQRWFFSDLNPAMWPVSAMAAGVMADRRIAPENNVFRRLEEQWGEMVSGSLDFYRDLRDASREAVFFLIYGTMMALGATGDGRTALGRELKANPHEVPYIKEILEGIEKGGYPEALARIGALIGQYAGAIPLYRLETAEEFVRSDKRLSQLSESEVRRLRSEAGVMVLLEPERTLKALPMLLSDPEERESILSLLEWGLGIEGITPEQRDMGRAIIELLRADTVLHSGSAGREVRSAPKKHAESRKSEKRSAKPGKSRRH